MQSQTSGREPTSRPEQRREARSHRVKRRQQEQAASRQRRIVTLAASAVVIVVVGLIAVRLLSPASGSAPAADAPASQSLLDQVTGVPESLLAQVGRGSAAQLPTPVRGDVQTGPNNLPLITYVGAEYCPFCAGERWPLIIALSRFGTFSGLNTSHSATDDIYPNTPTFSFLNSTYSSPYLDLNAVELQSNVRSGSGYQTLQTPTPAQNALLNTYDGPPYVPAQSAGSIPFIDIANQYVVSGANFDVGVLRNMNQDQVAAALADPNSAQAQAILGAANVLTAAICTATGNNPSNVCTAPEITALQSSLASTPAPTR
jgi:hypothetical protein